MHSPAAVNEDVSVSARRATRRPAPLTHAAEVVEAVLQSAPLTSDTRSFLYSVLVKPGRILAPHGPAIWPESVGAVALALGAASLPAAIAGAAVEFAVAAIDVADELIDDEWQGDAKSRARAVNASVTLAFLAQRCATLLSEPLGAERATLIGRLLADGATACCAGQDMDLLLEGADALDDDAYEMTMRKSGSLVAMAFRVAAAVATDDAQINAAAGALGTHIGVIAQLLNDLQDVGSDPSRRKGDIRRGKRTLPIAYALRYARDEQLHDVSAWLSGSQPLSADDEETLLQRMHDLGAQQFTWTVARAHRHEALAALRGLAELAERPRVLRLRKLIPGLAH